MSPVENKELPNGKQENGRSQLKDVSSNDISNDSRNESDSATMKVLPKGMDELVKQCFAPGVNGHFERKSKLPLLQLEHIPLDKLFADSLKSTESTEKQEGKQNGDTAKMNRFLAEENDCKEVDMSLINACWDVILSFVDDEEEILEKGQSTRLFESTILERRKHFSTKKKIWKKPSNDAGILESKLSNKKSTPARVKPDANGNDVPLKSDETVTSNEALTKMTVLEKVQSLATMGIKHTYLRDEIYCQLLKQLTCNPSLRSGTLGWILLSLIIGCFSPSSKIFGYVSQFLENQPIPCSVFCKQRLTRVLKNGNRKNPPCSLELQAAKSRLDIRFPVICMDHSVRTVWVDSSTTAEEMCQKLASKNRLGDSFGFSLFLALNNKLVTLGNGNFHILDAVSQAERFSKLNGVQDVWRVYYRREFFSLRDALGMQNNQMRVLLTYSQICGGVQSGEYECIKTQDLALLIAHQYCVKNGLKTLDTKQVTAICDQCLPSSIYKDDKKKKWCQMIHSTLQALQAKLQPNEDVDTLDIMQQVIRYASRAFINSFTKSFILSRFQDANGAEGCWVIDATFKLNHERIVVCTNNLHKITDVTKNNLENLLEAEVAKLKKIELLEQSDLEGSRVKVTFDGDEFYIMESAQAREIADILQRYMEENNALNSTQNH